MKKFIILTTPRTGSTYIRLWLNNHPHVRCHGEIFLRKYEALDGFKYFTSQKFARRLAHHIFCNKIMARVPFNLLSGNLIKVFLNSLYYNPMHSAPFKELGTGRMYHSQENPEDDQVVGFKLMYGQLWKYRFLYNWIRDNNLKIILLKRNNTLKMYLSRLLMKKRGFAHSSKTEGAQKVIVDSHQLLKCLNQNIRITDKIKKIFPSNPILEISYEDFFNKHSETSKRMQKFLCVKQMDVPVPSLKKVSPDFVRDIISNYDEVENVLKKTKFKHFLEQ